MKHIYLLIALLSLGYIGISQSQIIPVEETPPVPVGKTIADDLVNGINPELDRRIAHFKNRWETLWENPREKPDVIVGYMGNRADRFFLAGSIERDYMQAIATATGQTFAELVGDEKYITTKYPVTVNPDGTVTVDMPQE